MLGAEYSEINVLACACACDAVSDASDMYDESDASDTRACMHQICAMLLIHASDASDAASHKSDVSCMQVAIHHIITPTMSHHQL